MRKQVCKSVPKEHPTSVPARIRSIFDLLDMLVIILVSSSVLLRLTMKDTAIVPEDDIPIDLGSK